MATNMKSKAGYDKTAQIIGMTVLRRNTKIKKNGIAASNNHPIR